MWLNSSRSLGQIPVGADLAPCLWKCVVFFNCLPPANLKQRVLHRSQALFSQDISNQGPRMSELEKAFRKFATYGDMAATGNDMTGKNFSKMLKDCGVMDGKAVTSTDVDIVFNKVKTKGARTINFAEFQQAMKELCGKRFKGKSPEEALQAVYALMEGKEPANVGVTKTTTAGGVDRLTDTSKYTGSHKERFDESGKGKGIAGREDVTDGSGYVGAYKGAGTYDKKH
uniref:Uncharacterized protein n=2 Tax=Gopherus agassizii TaxID=38772 RepID=A0A452HX70_9SAUR